MMKRVFIILLLFCSGLVYSQSFIEASEFYSENVSSTDTLYRWESFFSRDNGSVTVNFTNLSANDGKISIYYIESDGTLTEANNLTSVTLPITLDKTDTDYMTISNNDADTSNTVKFRFDSWDAKGMALWYDKGSNANDTLDVVIIK